MKEYIKIRIKTKDKSKAILKLNELGISLTNVSYGGDYIDLVILKNDLKRIKRYMLTYDIEKIDNVGITKFKNIIKKNRLYICAIILFIFLFLLLSNVIVKINVVHENKELRDLIFMALEDRGVTRLSLKKSYDEYESIIKEIKEKYKDKIEWLEIDVDGMILNIRVEERIIKNFNKTTGTCHIIASKDGTISKVLAKKGVSITPLNKHVKKGDILISGEIKLNEEVKENVCADGEVYAEVWYNASINLPLNYEEKTKTGKMRYNFMVKNKNSETIILKSRVDKKVTEKVKLFSFFGIEFYVLKEYEIKSEKRKYTEEEAIEKSIELAKEKLMTKDSKRKVITEKVLQKSVINDNLDIDIFIVLEEQIGIKEEYTVRDDVNEIRNGNT